MTNYVYRLPIKLVSLTNAREHWRDRAKRAKEQRGLACMVVHAHPTPCVVTITRLGPRKLDDDNLASSAKHVRDGVADKLGVDDGDETAVRWVYRQELSKGYGVNIQIEAAP